MTPCSIQFLMLSVLRSSDRASSVIFTTAPGSVVTAGLADSSSWSSSSQPPSCACSESSWHLPSLRWSPANCAPSPQRRTRARRFHDSRPRTTWWSRLGSTIRPTPPCTPPDERTFYACPPHRIGTCASILRDTYEPDPVNNALPLLPDWVQWCARRTELNRELTDRALVAARAEAATSASEYPVITERESPFRRPE
jgi:hypothetical protein